MALSFQDILVALAANLAVLTLAVTTYIQIKIFLRRLPRRFEPLLIGLAFGLTAILAMAMRFPVAPGVFVDGRAVPIGLAAPFGGPLAAVIAAVLAVVYRAAIGGTGMAAGTVGIIAAACCGMLIALRRRRGGGRLTHADLLLLGGLLVFSTLIGTLFLSGPELIYAVIAASFLPEAIALPLGTLFLGTLLIQEQRRRTFEAAVAESERRFQTITDNVPGVVYQRLLTGAGEISYPFFSARIQDLFGVTAREAMADASKILDAIHVADFDRFSASIKESARDLSVWSHEYRVVQPDGTIRWVQDEAAPHRREDGDVVWDGIITDETERKTAEMALNTANGLLTMANQRLSNLYEAAHQFVDDVAHEFRTPLTVIWEYASILDEGLVGDLNDEQREYLRVVCARVNDLNGLVNDMLDLSRLEAGMISAVRGECTIQDVIGRVRTTLTRRAQASGVAFAIDVEDDLPPLYCDPEKIGRVLINLAINAFKYGGERGGVQLWARRGLDEPHVVFGVTDHGPGIPADKLDMIFERFKQAGGLRDTAKGFGLGLSIVRELVDLNLGDVFVQSVVGEGTTFSFTVPVFDLPGIVSHYVAKLARQRPSLFFVSEIGIWLPDGAGPGAGEVCDAFLQQHLQRHELLLRQGPNRWLLLSADLRDADVRARAHSLRESFRAHAAEIGDEVPATEVQPTGIWRLPNQFDALVARFRMQNDAALARRSA